MKAKPGEIWLAKLGLAAKVRQCWLFRVMIPRPLVPLPSISYSQPNTVAVDTKYRWDRHSFSIRSRSSMSKVWEAEL
jgi:hypothetical protein